MIIISLRFSGGSTDEAHDIAHIASSIVARVSGLFLFSPHSFALRLQACLQPHSERIPRISINTLAHGALAKRL